MHAFRRTRRTGLQSGAQSHAGGLEQVRDKLEAAGHQALAFVEDVAEQAATFTYGGGLGLSATGPAGTALTHDSRVDLGADAGQQVVDILDQDADGLGDFGVRAAGTVIASSGRYQHAAVGRSRRPLTRRSRC